MERSTARAYIYPQGPHSQILMTVWGGGRGEGSDRGSYFIPQKITTLEFVYPKKSLLFFSIPKKNPLVLFSQPKKIPLYFFETQKYPDVLHRPKKITFGQNFRPKKITQTLPSLQYVSGAPVHLSCHNSPNSRTTAVQSEEK